MFLKNSLLVLMLASLALLPPSLAAQESQQTEEAQEDSGLRQTEESPEAPEARERDNNQNVVIGWGFGGHTFDTPHQTGQDSTGLEVISAFMQQMYGEWYVFDSLGVGLRLIHFGTTVSSTTTVTIGSSTFVSSYEADLSINNLLFTIHWVPFGGRGYARMGLLAGLGGTRYEFSETYTNASGVDSTSTTSGPAALLGIYVDWGGEGFGARAGMHYLATELDDINGAPVDASGRDIYIDLRWAF